MLISLAVTIYSASLQVQTPFAIVRSRVHPSQLEKFDRLPIEPIFARAGFASAESMPALFKKLQNGSGKVNVFQDVEGSATGNLIFVSISESGGSSKLTMAIDSSTGRLRTWEFSMDSGDHWKVSGWQTNEASARRIAEGFIKPNFPESAFLAPQTIVPIDQSLSESLTKRIWFIPYQWELDGRNVGVTQAASVQIDAKSGAILNYTGIIAEIQRRALFPGEAGQSRAFLVQRLVTRFGNGSYGLSRRNLIYSPRAGARGLYVANWQLQCTEYDHLGRRSAMIQIVMDPESKAILHEDRSGGGFGPSSPVPGSQIAGEWQAGEIKGQIRTTDRKATQGGVQRTLTSGNRLLVGTFFAAERLLEVKGVFFEVDPALSEALAKAQP